jgi:hypothetical protein
MSIDVSSDGRKVRPERRRVSRSAVNGGAMAVNTGFGGQCRGL